jgi:hypothetical protein
MQPYLNHSGNSGVSAYENGCDSITLSFDGGGTYLYTVQSAGAENIRRMKNLAAVGEGLSAFVSRNVRGRYAAKVGG